MAMDNFAENVRDKSPPRTDPGVLGAALAGLGTMSAREIVDHFGPDEGDREAVEALVREVVVWHDITPKAVTECADNDSPWLVCKTCAAVGRCAKEPQRPAAADGFCWLVELFEPDGNSMGHYHTGATTLPSFESRTTRDPLKAKRYATKRDALLACAGLLHLKGVWRAVEHGFAPDNL